MTTKERYKKLKDKGTCTQCCKRPKEINRGVCGRCRPLINAYRKGRYRQLQQHLKEYDRRRYRQRKELVLAALGGKCQCCGEERWGVLTLSHINSDGAEDRRLRRGQRNIYNSLISIIKKGADIPNRYGIECYNCNCGSFRNNKICPHKMPVCLETLNYKRRLHKGIIVKYGSVCDICNEDELGFLTIDHINGGGRREIREEFNQEHSNFYRHLRDSPIRKDIRILCYNCNSGLSVEKKGK